MGKLLDYANNKDELNRQIADKATKLIQDDMTGTLTMNDAIEIAKEIIFREGE